ncbi:Uncharacterised protein [Burkholderia pseudomallei]|uniref:DUF4365 domain-containing protein n=1 Tax=Burkholderia pseudomallei TaxID=28450 RepID=UPI0005DC6C91|nr:DUF4365 domain-containing protein [Burkholderia pseudomallei]CAK1314620.1 Uncharacterised protein [Burkholderia pseudomallei]
MKYANKNAIGHAGEYFFAFTITDVLKWPCRLLDIDIGIDAQVEVLADDGESLGDVIAVQVKATSKRARSVKVTAEHVRYWESVKTPVIIALVCLQTRKIYWRTLPRSKQATRRLGSSGVEVTVKFDEAKDLLHDASKEALRKLAYAKTKAKIRNVLHGVVRKARYVIAETTEEERISVGPGPDHYIELIETVRAIEDRLSRLRPQVIAVKEHIGTCGYRKALALAIEASDRLRWFIDEAKESFTDQQLRDRDAYFEYHSMGKLSL